ncbi:autotransporter family protein [Microbulbifer agarilyticus]|uniref:autotransporter family protein n=1 Tax=Microbulbifer agarilyticus TaxID=260552 RepID=UPI001CD6D2FA|nr:autotransporter outer membrane beta-barrel domain-containing protein [Microbulbifer agarilyticus]MCA0899732.1 autotransporter outer membrane beta-barrel domain-containing protein [Microbulbifer agarilyticus]
MLYSRVTRDVGAGTAAVLLTPLLTILPLLPHSAYAQIQLDDGDNQYILEADDRAAGNNALLIDGGNGFDTLTLRDVVISNPARLQRWESIVLDGASRLTLDTTLVLGDDGGHPGRLRIGSDSTLALPHLGAAITPYRDQRLSLVNHGVIDMRGSTANQLLVQGDYSGTGIIHMDMIAGDDDSLADRLIVNSGHASGSTQLVFERFSGNGADTIDGILVVEATNGATTASGAFYMDSPISAGPYEYFLFRGARNPEDNDNWFLRSNLLPGDAGRDESNGLNQVTSSGTAGIETGASPAAAPLLNLAAANTITKPLPLYRPEIPLYAQAKSLARLTSLQEIGSYHKRRGEQRSWFDGINQEWARVHHTRADYNWHGDVDNRFDGNISGFQVGKNFWAGPTCTGGAREMGLFVGSTRTNGDVTGFARGFNNYDAGRNQLTSHHLGYYFNDYRPNMGYFDFTAKVAYVKMHSQSTRGIGDTVTGPQLTLSMEKGLTWQVSESLNLEPQLQAVVNYTNFSAYEDGISWVDTDKTPEANFRAGIRGYNVDSQWFDGNLRLYLFGNLWHTLGGNDQLVYNLDQQTDLEREATWGEFGAGAVLLESQYGSAFINVGYQTSLDGLNWSGGNASLGFNWAW